MLVFFDNGVCIMKYRELGKTGMKVSVIGLGGGVFNVNKDPTLTVKEARNVVSHAVENGINIIDTSKEYDEEFLSNVIDDLEDELKIITKSEARSRKKMKNDMKDSFDKMGKDFVDIYQLHMVNSIKDLNNRIDAGVLDVLKDAKRDGTIGHIGIFSHKIDVLKEAIKTDEFDVVTTLYNAAHTKSDELNSLGESFDVGLIAAAPLANGILVLPKYGRKSDVKGDVSQMNVESALKFVLSNKNFSTALVGSRNMPHIKENVKMGDINFDISQGERAEIERKVLEFLGEDFCRGCRYCEPCDVHGDKLPISDILKLKILYERYGLKNFAKNQYLMKKKVHGIPECTKCMKCEIKCPYNVPIVDELDDAIRLFENG